MAVIDRVKDKALRQLIQRWAMKREPVFEVERTSDGYMVVCLHKVDHVGTMSDIVIDDLSKQEAECLAKKCRAARNELQRARS